MRVRTEEEFLKLIPELAKYLEVPYRTTPLVVTNPVTDEKVFYVRLDVWFPNLQKSETVIVKNDLEARNLLDVVWNLKLFMDRKVCKHLYG